jgi:hypothetical protein
VSQHSVEQMWEALAAYQRYASLRGYGEHWERMLIARSETDCYQVSDAAWLFAMTWLDESSYDAHEAVECVCGSLMAGTEKAKRSYRQDAASLILTAIEKHDSRKLILSFVGANN